MHSNTNAAVLRHRVASVEAGRVVGVFQLRAVHTRFATREQTHFYFAATSNAFVWRVTCHKWVESNRGVNNVQTMAIKLFNRVWPLESMKCRGPRLIPPPPLVSGPPHSGPAHLLQSFYSPRLPTTTFVSNCGKTHK